MGFHIRITLCARNAQSRTNSEQNDRRINEEYARSPYAEAEWQEAWRIDPTGEQRRLLVFRIEDCSRPGLLGQLVSDDLFDVEESVARSRLLAAVRQIRRKPPLPPEFPATEAPSDPQPFPGRLVEVPGIEAVQAGGPATRDNPFAIAFAFWYVVLNQKYEDLGDLITPESRGKWDLADVARRTGDGGITTGVMKPCYDVAYVRIASGVPPGRNVGYKVAGGLMPVEARVISLVYRPELGGWRVHGIGIPLDPDQLPRSWQP
jgi:hypothetical protein